MGWMKRFGNEMEERERRAIGQSSPACLTPPKVEIPSQISAFINTEGEKCTVFDPKRSGSEGASFEDTDSFDKPTLETKVESLIP